MQLDSVKYRCLVGDQRDVAEAAASVFSAEGAGPEGGDWSGIGIPEELGGSGGGLAELAVVMEECGAATAPSHIPWTLGVVARVLLGATDLPEALLADVARGTVATSIPATQLDHAGSLFAEQSLGGRLEGSVVALGPADAILALPIIVANSHGVAMIDPEHHGVTVTELQAMDVSRPWTRYDIYGLSTDDVPFYRVPDLFSRWRIAVATYCGLDAAGAARAALARTVEYAQIREQFGRPIGSFQAYKHRCATAFVDLKLAQSVAFQAANSDSFESASRYALASAIEATASATRVCMDAIQLHGGIAYSWESGLHRYLRRSRADEILGGRAQTSRTLLGTLTATNPSAPVVNSENNGAPQTDLNVGSLEATSDGG